MCIRDRIENLHAINMRQEKEKMQVEYEALLSQINPHFLFNALDCLRGMALKYKEMCIRDRSKTSSVPDIIVQAGILVPWN